MKVSTKVIGEIEHLIDVAYEALEEGDSGKSGKARHKKTKNRKETGADRDFAKTNFETAPSFPNQNETSDAVKKPKKTQNSLSPIQKAFIYSEILHRKYT